jgi:hypothetical protein
MIRFTKAEILDFLTARTATIGSRCSVPTGSGIQRRSRRARIRCQIALHDGRGSHGRIFGYRHGARRLQSARNTLCAILAESSSLADSRTVRAPERLLRRLRQSLSQALSQGRAERDSMVPYTRLVRNAVPHNFRFEFRTSDEAILPVTWNGNSIDIHCKGKDITYEPFWHRRAMSCSWR